MGRVRSVALSLGLGAMIVYLATHAITGRQGLIAFMELKRQERVLLAERHALAIERAALERRAARLRPESLDLDYLDERARALLAAGDPAELVFAIDGRGS